MAAITQSNFSAFDSTILPDQRWRSGRVIVLLLATVFAAAIDSQSAAAEESDVASSSFAEPETAWRTRLSDDPFTLTDAIDWSDGITVDGWVAQGFTWNPDSPADRFNGFLTNNDRANEYQLNQVYLAVRKEADVESEEISFGFEADFLYGSDAFVFQSLGWDDHTVSDSDSRFNKLAIPTFNVQAFLPVGDGATLTLGKWYALVGYESGLAGNDFFYSHTLGFNVTPYTHTGALLEFGVGEQWYFAQGVHRGQDVWEDNNNNLGYTGSATWTSLDEATSIAFAMVYGPEQDERADWQDIDGTPGPDSPGKNLYRLNYSIYVEHEFDERTNGLLVYNYFLQNGSSNFALEDAEAYSLAGSLFYEVNDVCTAGVRVEVARDDDAYVGTGFRSFNATAPSVFSNLTLGLNVRPVENLTIRPEVRWDWQDRDNSSDTPAFDDGSDNNQFLVACDFVLTF